MSEESKTEETGTEGQQGAWGPQRMREMMAACPCAAMCREMMAAFREPGEQAPDSPGENAGPHDDDAGRSG